MHRIATLCAAAGLALRGAFHPAPHDAVLDVADGAPVGTLVLLGFAGGVGWPAFAASAEAGDGVAHPLDRWSRRVIGGIADDVGGMALFPFGGAPFLPFQRWARRAEAVFDSPLGLSIHPRWGLWHSYRGAVALRERLALPAREHAVHPCENCVAQPCMSACPVSAFSPDSYDVGVCAAHVRSPAGGDCRANGCLARRACPVGIAWTYSAEQAEFHMEGFLAARG